MRLLPLLCLLNISAAGFAGPLSKFDAKPPVLNLDTPKKLEDVERCLIDMDNVIAPTVYRQPDRPDAATIVWTAGSGNTFGRVDLRRSGAGTHVTSWLNLKQVTACASGQ